MQRIARIQCRLGWHQWSPWNSTMTTLETATGCDALDSIEGKLVIETRTRSCHQCEKDQLKQLLHW